MKYINILNKIIEYSFYAIFFLIPIVLDPNTSELFEFNKMWLTFILSLVILAAWGSKMVIKRQFKIQRTPLDIPILLFLLSQIISSIFTLDRHVSLWGYYSRFNGGLFSIMAYIFLYYAFVSNFRENAKAVVKRLIFVTLSSGVIVALWGLPSHFGYDPTCLVFRGTFDVSCWTSAFQPKVRIFSTLGQPDWMAAYLAALLPIVAALLIKTPIFKTLNNGKSVFSKKNLAIGIAYFLIFLLFYVDLLYTGSRSGVLALWLGAIFFAAAYFFLEKRIREIKIKSLTLDFKLLGLAVLAVAVVSFFVPPPFQQIDKFTFGGIMQQLTKPKVVNQIKPSASPAASSGQELGGTDSGKIRLFVWQGAIEAWLHNPIFGTGVETFAFAYYEYRPAGHNLTSEWNYLYNKAHNEYLNYLATTGAFGLLTYLSMIGLFLYLSAKYLLKDKKEDTNNRKILILAIISGYITILISNFFGFSVVIINLFLFLMPALVFILANLIDYNKTLSFSFAKKKETLPGKEEYRMTMPIWILITAIVIITGYFVYMLYTYWNADKAYALGYNYDQAQNYQAAYPYLHQAVLERPGEPVFKDELSINDAVLAIELLKQAQQNPKQATQAAQLAQKLAQEAINVSDEVTSQHPNNVVFWKTRVRVFYTLAQADQSYYPLALAAIKKAAQLAPTDADISYNLGILYGQTGDVKNAVSTLENTIKLKYDYTDAYYALGIFYHQLAINSKGDVVNQQYQQKAIDTMKEMLKLSPGDTRPIDALKAWNTGK